MVSERYNKEVEKEQEEEEFIFIFKLFNCIRILILRVSLFIVTRRLH